MSRVVTKTKASNKYKNSGHKNTIDGATIYYSTFDTRFGLCLVASTDKGVCNVLFSDSGDGGREIVQDLKTRWPRAILEKKSVSMHREVEKYFRNNSKNKKSKDKVVAVDADATAGLGVLGEKIKIHLQGTDFQIKVWEALLSIPKGETSTYGDIAEKLGGKGLARAVGTAIGDNPIGYLVPCHRVLKSTGGLGGYRWGVDRKRVMLESEGVGR